MKLKGEITNVIKGELEITKEEASSAIDFIDKIIPDFVKDSGGLFSDNVKFWRWKNQVKIVLKAREFLNSKNIEPQKIPLKILVPLLENASLEENHEIQDMWATLLSKYLAGDKSIKFNFITTLKEISPLEVKVLDWLYEQKILNKTKSAEMEISISASEISKVLEIKEETSKSIIENFLRLGIVIQKSEGASSSRLVFGNIVMGGHVAITEKFILGHFSFSLIDACKNKLKTK
jgi:hypothetical protein